MSILTLIFLIAIGFSKNLLGSDAAIDLHQRLPKLDDATMEATFGRSSYHSVSMREKIGLFHLSGDTWSSAELEEYFLTGIFQHYVHELCGFDMTLDYESNTLPESAYIIKKILGEDYTETILSCDLATLLSHVTAELKNNPIFVGLGICFHRNKVKLEKHGAELSKIPETARTLPHNESIVAGLWTLIMSTDRLAIDQQTAFYYWIKKVIERSTDHIKLIFETSGRLPEIADGSLFTICKQEPDFMKWPVYAALVPLALDEKS